MSLIQVKLVKGAYSDQQKSEMIVRLTDAMLEVEGSALRSTIWVTIEEVDAGSWALGGRSLTAQDMRDLRARADPT